MAAMTRQSKNASTARVVVVGGGVAGCATAIALARTGVSDVVVLDASPTQRIRVGETIPPDARRLLMLLGLGAAFDAEGHAPCYGSASSWGSDELGFNDHFVHPLGHGYHLDRQKFDAWMGTSAEQAGARRIRGARVTDVRRVGDHWQLEISPARTALASGLAEQRITADMLIDATGVLSALGRRLGGRRLEHDRLTYLACTLAPDPDGSRSGLTWLEATRDGFWYAAELPDGTFTLAITTDGDVVRAQQLFTRDGFFRAFEETRHLVPLLRHRICRDDKPSAWTAHSSLLGPPAGPAWLAVGDAAAAYDPISARGIHKALEDGLRAATAVRDTLRGDRDAISRYACHSILAFRTYLEQRAYLYAQESRWPDAPFWKRRATRRNLLGGESTPSSHIRSRLENQHV